MVWTHSTIRAPHRPDHLTRVSLRRPPASRAGVMGEKAQAADSRVQVAVSRVISCRGLVLLRTRPGSPSPRSELGELRPRECSTHRWTREPRRSACARGSKGRGWRDPGPARPNAAALTVWAATRGAKPHPSAVVPVSNAHVRSRNRPRITVGVSSKRVFLHAHTHPQLGCSAFQHPPADRHLFPTLVEGSANPTPVRKALVQSFPWPGLEGS